MIKILFKEISKKKDKENINDYEQLGREFGKRLWNLRSEINLNKNALECSQTIQEYYNAFPDFLNNFFLEWLLFLILKIWLPQILASLGHMPRLLGSFRQLLNICHITSYTDRHERKLAKDRIEKSDPTKRLIRSNNI
ncbi:hypothetical protein RhiirC2_784760 [Rhizophagus irregularis]|uniref:Uncharacterized protein n=1 Tax=Rhizophagus irregularis TaxID=588596 RepID=A0A2N1MXZ9_9GLOM|nr:hypothetical protein RhiirC2_784760 [Rhizophagus irregularis]